MSKLFQSIKNGDTRQDKRQKVILQAFLQVENLIFKVTSFIAGVFAQLRGNILSLRQTNSELRKEGLP
jgi:hypothetical protein